MNRSRLFVFIITLFTAFVLASPLNAATFKTIPPLPGFDVFSVFMTGEIVSGDADAFEKLIQGRKKVSVLLSGPGGSLSEGLSIGASIRQHNFATQVLPDDECDSACALIWASGARRYMSPSSRIGFHAASKSVDGKRVEIGQGNAELGAYLNTLGLRIEAIRFFTEKGPNEVSYLTPDIARQLGIETLQLNVNEADPTQIPAAHKPATVDDLVMRHVMYALLGFCPSDLDIDRALVDQGDKNAFDEGVSLVGYDQFARLFAHRVRELKASIGNKSNLWKCVHAITFLSQSQQAAAFAHPSFDCSANLTNTEQTICNDPPLRGYDVAATYLYKTAIQSANKALRQKVKQVQVMFLKDRNSCGSNRDCIEAMYLAKLKPLLSQ